MHRIDCDFEMLDASKDRFFQPLTVLCSITHNRNIIANFTLRMLLYKFGDS